MNISPETLKLYRLDCVALSAIRYIATTDDREWSAEYRLERIRTELSRHESGEREANGANT